MGSFSSALEAKVSHCWSSIPCSGKWRRKRAIGTMESQGGDASGVFGWVSRCFRKSSAFLVFLGNGLFEISWILRGMDLGSKMFV